MEATSITEHPDNVFTTPDGRYRLLKSVAIYGANASGKSNLIAAMRYMYNLVMLNLKLNSTDVLDATPFELSSDKKSAPSFFEVVFLIENIRYRYGFEVDNKKIQTEWLFETKVNTEKPFFIRDGLNIDRASAFKEGKGLEEKTGENKLYLLIVDQFNGFIAKKILNFFGRIVPISALYHSDFSHHSLEILTTESLVTGFKEFLVGFNLGFIDITAHLEGNGDFTFLTTHNIYDSKKKVLSAIQFDSHESESQGTNKLIDLAGILYIALAQGGMFLFFDELDASLHPLMTLAITKLFNSKENNSKNAQLIFTTHDTNLLSKGGFRRDQIYFVEKDNYEASHLYSLAEFKEPDGKKVRKDRSFEEDYIEGRYGAIPYIGDFSKLLGNGK